MKLPANGDSGLSGPQFFRSRTPQATIVKILLCLVLGGATANAQDLTRTQLTESTSDFFPLPEIHWADVAPAGVQVAASPSDPAPQQPGLDGMASRAIAVGGSTSWCVPRTSDAGTRPAPITG
jgi:hypothetical protein